MNDIMTLHTQAMEFADEADQLSRVGDVEAAESSLRAALDREREAALRLAVDYDLEPTRSVLLRSAASLAFQLKDYRECERLAALGLAGVPPVELLDELRELMDRASFQRHLDLRGIELSPTHFQLSVAGPAVGPGIAPAKDFVTRLETAQQMAIRTAERKLNRPYRESGPSKTGDVELHVSTLRAASVAVSLHVGMSGGQLALPGVPSVASEVVEELVKCLRLYQAGDIQGLTERIPDVAYLRNFVGLSRKLIPDGKRLSMVGIVARIAEADVQIVLDANDGEIPLPAMESSTPPEGSRSTEAVSITGYLKFADEAGAEEKIKLVDGARTHVVIVPDGLMADIVRPYWGDKVRINGYRENNKKQVMMIDITPIDDDTAPQP